MNFKRFKFSTVEKYVVETWYNFIKIFKFIDLRRYNFRKISKIINIRGFQVPNIIQYLNIKSYKFSDLKKVKFINNKILFIHVPASIIFFGFLYLFIPTFFNYDKSKIESVICNNKMIECIIRGKIIYRFYPTPRIKISDIIINDIDKRKKTLITADDTTIKLSVKNLLAKEKHKFKKINFKNSEINFRFQDFKKNNNILKKTSNFIPISFKKSKIILLDGKEYVATITNVDINTESKKQIFKTELKGNFLNDNILVSIDSKKIENKEETDIKIKMSNFNFFTKINFSNLENNEGSKSGNFLIKKDKNIITALFDYKENKLKIKKSNVRNTFIDGKLEGTVILQPYFNFNLDLSLNSLNFTKLYNYFLSLDDEKKKKIFRFNKKINGKLNLSSEKIYSGYNLVKSFESRLKFDNGSLLIDQFLFNLGKLGAADMLGSINNDKKFNNLKFESNIFIDNQKKFLSKFGIYNKKSIPSNLFISGNLDLENLRGTFYEISDDKKLENEDVNFIENEFNDYMLVDGYKSLFLFQEFKKFVKSITNEIN